MEKRKIELLAPAGDMERLKMAVAYGADAVYLAGTTFGMRAFAGNFDQDELYQAVRYCKAHGVDAHVTINTMPRCSEVKELPAWLEVLEDAGVTAVIVADLGAFRLAQKYAPHVQKHISTQASICNYETANAWYDLGASRVILAREVPLEDIREIRQKTPPELEIEAFVHGAMCVSYSGRCLLSNYMTGRDSSRGACAQPCRYQYYLMEEKRPGEYFPVFEDNKGTYIMNSRDMCMIDHVAELMDAGLNSLKIEGRAKSAYYAAIVTGAYRHAIDAAAAGDPFGSGLAGRGGKGEPPALFHRLLLRLPRPVLRGLPLYPRLAGGRHRPGLHGGRPCHPVPAQQVQGRRPGGAGRPRLQANGFCRTYDDGRGRQLFGGAEKAPDAVPDAAAPCRPTPVHSSARSGVDAVTGTCYNKLVTSLRRNIAETKRAVTKASKANGGGCKPRDGQSQQPFPSGLGGPGRPIPVTG